MWRRGELRGFLYKRGKLTSRWQRRWCILAKESLSYYKDTSSKRPQGRIAVKQIGALTRSQGTKAKDSGRTSRKPDAVDGVALMGFMSMDVAGGGRFSGNNRTFIFSSAMESTMDEWYLALVRKKSR